MSGATRTSLPPRTGKDDTSGRLVLQGRSLSIQLCVLLKTARIHDVGNLAFQGPMSALIETVDQMWTAEGKFKLQAIGDFLYVNQQRLRVDASSYPSYQFLIDELKARDLSGFSFAGRLTPPEVKKFVRLFLDVDLKSESPFDDFSAALGKLSVQNIVPIRTVVPKEGAVTAEERRDSRKVAKRGFYRAIESARTVMLSARDHRPVDLRKAKRAVQSIVDLIIDEEFSLLGLTAIKNHDEYTFQHCVNVSILSIAVGQRLGLSKKMLGELGVAALLHDLGKASIPPWVLNKAGKLTPEEWKLVVDHPVQGVKMIARMRGLNELALRCMIVAYEHHINFDKSGYPQLEGHMDQSLFSRIVAIVDCFDAMTAHRAYRKNAFLLRRAPPDHLAEPEQVRSAPDQGVHQHGGNVSGRHHGAPRHERDRGAWSLAHRDRHLPPEGAGGRRLGPQAGPGRADLRPHRPRRGQLQLPGDDRLRAGPRGSTESTSRTC